MNNMIVFQVNSTIDCDLRCIENNSNITTYLMILISTIPHLG